jgi:hypothetical protein
MYGLMGGPNIEKLVQYTKDEGSKGTIDDPVNMHDDKIYLFSGTQDSVVNPKVMFALEDYYDAFVSPSNVVTTFDFTAEHTWPSLAYGNPCTQLKSPYIGICDFDGSGRVLNAMYSDLSPAGRKSIHFPHSRV